MNINEIIEKLKTDKAFTAKYEALGNIEDIMTQAAKDGYDVTRRHVEDIIRELGQKTGELSEADLAVVAGGSIKIKCPRCGSGDVTIIGKHQTVRCNDCNHSW